MFSKKRWKSVEILNLEVVMFTLFLVRRVLTIEVVEYSLSCRVLTLAYSTGCSGCKVPKIISFNTKKYVGTKNIWNIIL